MCQARHEQCIYLQVGTSVSTAGGFHFTGKHLTTPSLPLTSSATPLGRIPPSSLHRLCRKGFHMALTRALLLMLMLLMPTISRAYKVDPPTTASNDTVQDCTNWAIVNDRDTCDSLAAVNNITFSQLCSYVSCSAFQLFHLGEILKSNISTPSQVHTYIQAKYLNLQNPSLSRKECSPILDGSYCIEQNFGISMPLANTTGTLPYSTTPAYYANSTSIATVSTPIPVQTGLLSNCGRFQRVKAGDTCSSIAQGANVSLADLCSWNRGVGTECQYLFQNYFICVGITGTSLTLDITTTASKTTTTTTTTTTTRSSRITTPTPFQSGMTANCARFYSVGPGDTCIRIVSVANVTLSALYQWNPAVGDKCQTLWLGYHVCIGI